MRTIDEFSRAADFQHDCVVAGRPGVLRGGIADWPAVQHWTPQSLIDRIGERIFDVATSADAVFRYSAGTTQRARLAFRDAVRRITAPLADAAAVYVMQVPLEQHLPELTADISRPPGLPAEQAVALFWFGAAGNVTPVHYDGVNNLFGQVHGRKRFLLFAPADTDGLYPLPAQCAAAHFGAVDVENPDLGRFPLHASVSPLVVELGPGDLLHLPPFFWHHVRSLDTSISVNFWWAPRFDQCLVRPMLPLLRASYVQDRLASVGRPIAGYPGGLSAAAERALALQAHEFAVLLAAAALAPGDAPAALAGVADRVAAGGGCAAEEAIAAVTAMLTHRRSSPRGSEPESNR